MFHSEGACCSTVWNPRLHAAGLRKHIGVVFQDTFLFGTTVGANIALGPRGANETESCGSTGCHAWEFIEPLPRGLDTPVGQRGVQLARGRSNASRSRGHYCAIPRILILDEPTSALDARSEHLLQVP